MPRAAPSKVACQRCHEKRVKCDRSDSGEGRPCTQCQIARLNCIPKTSRRGSPMISLTRPFNNSQVDAPERNVQLHAIQNGSVQTRSEQTPPTLDQLLTTRAQANAVHEGSISTFHNFQRDPSERNVQPYTGSRPIQNTTVQARDEQTPYMVDPSNISYLIREFGHPQEASNTEGRPIGEYLHKAMLDTLDQPTVQHIDNSRNFTIERLKRQGAFDLPAPGIVSPLLDTFFQHSFPSIPILDKSEFMTKIEANTCSPLLLNAIFMVATIYCPGSLISEAGFVSRFVASLTFYHRAKDIYDAGYETDAITVIQATFLLSHWWSGPLEQKDPWYWLGVTAGMAQGIGMHQMKTYSLLHGQRRALWRRIWWIVYAADIHMSMCLDRVPHVSDSFCEIPTITEVDLEDLLGEDLQGGIGTVREQVLFVINYVQLARTVNASHPWQNSELNPSLHKKFIDRISEWSKSLPLELAFPTSRSPWAMLTQITNDLYQLLSYRKSPGAERSTKPGSPVYEISTRLFRIFEDLMTSCHFLFIAGHMFVCFYSSCLTSVVTHSLLYSLPATMATLCIHIANVSQGDSQARKISEHRAKFCMFILKESEESWPIIASVYPFFASLFKRHSNGAQEEARNPQTNQKKDDAAPGSGHLSGREDDWLYERLLLDDGPAMSNPSFPFCNLFDIFLTPPSDDPTL
ncbi:fungal-specific transcription factor domain-containing protein [Penicillium angulare]|uniref:fungal-specific transcription factor domain-containing protein n=1 Tax=Penicillium angulare TaxID=116970 RepID=UPI00253F6551|nr:fungal-specific transcription factor domain-containing protein [Penicillium angulare]KAJ5289026.1 fungal-specific transcription factor domain-containing protein [Penicillium angulare]